MSQHQQQWPSFLGMVYSDKQLAAFNCSLFEFSSCTKRQHFSELLIPPQRKYKQLKADL